MDDHDHHDTNVVNLRRKDDLTRRGSGQVASTIFADEDEISTFSQGNLVPPRPPSQPATHEPDKPDPFFEKHLQQAPHAEGRVATAGRTAETDEYFGALVEQTASEMAQQIRAPESARPLAAAGSATLPLEVSPNRDRRPRLPRPERRTADQGGTRMAKRSAAISATIALLAATTLALLVMTHDSKPASTPRSAVWPQLASILDLDRSPFGLLGSALQNPLASVSSSHQARHPRTRHRIRKSRRADRARHRASPAATKDSAATAPGRQSTPDTTSTPTTSSPITPAAGGSSAPATGSSAPTSGPSTRTAAGSSNPPAFGPNGALGPGHSSIG